MGSQIVGVALKSAGSWNRLSRSRRGGSKVGTMSELSAKPQKMPHGETKQTIVARLAGPSKPIWSSAVLHQYALGSGISLMTFISQHQNVTPTIEIEASFTQSLSQNCCWCQLQKFMVMHWALSRPSAEQWVCQQGTHTQGSSTATTYVREVAINTRLSYSRSFVLGESSHRKRTTARTAIRIQ